MKFILMQQVEADSLAEALPKFCNATVVINQAPETTQLAEPNTQRLGTQSAVHAVLKNKGKELKTQDLTQTTGLTIKQVSNALTNLRNKGMAKSNVRGWYKL